MPQERGSRLWFWVPLGCGTFLVLVVIAIAILLFALRGSRQEEFTGFGSKIGVVDLEGVIVSPDETVRQLKAFADDDSVKAIILHINSPGGGAAASEEIYREVGRIRDDKKKRIVASIESVGASGAYYVASATNKIFADNASVVGSIGVIAEWYNYGDLLRWAKLKEVVITAGEFKDMGDPARELTPAERQILQQMIDNMHAQFIAAVAAGRGVSPDDIRPIADGRVWTGQQAIPLKLVDQIGGFRACVEDTARAVGIQGEPKLVRAHEPSRSLLDMLIGDASDVIPDRAKLMEKQPGFYFLWK